MELNPSLATLPGDILLEMIVYLPIAERNGLRLVCRALSQQLTPAYTMSKTIIADSEHDLRLFIAMTEPRQPGCMIQELILIHDVPVPRPYIRRRASRWTRKKVVGLRASRLSIETSAEMLCQAFTNLRKNSGAGILERLTLRRRRRRNVRADNHETELFERAALALSASELPIHALGFQGMEMYRTADGVDLVDRQFGRNKLRQWTKIDGSTSYPWFILELDGLSTLLKKVDLRPSFKSLQDLSLWFQPVAPSECGVISGICKLLGWCPNLRTLHLQGHHAWRVHEASLLQQIVDRCDFHQLKSCNLSAFGISDGELLVFLKKFSTLESLSLEAIYLTDQEWNDVLSHIFNNMPKLNHIHLDNLREIVGPVHVYPEGPSERMVSERTMQMLRNEAVFFENGDSSHYGWFESHAGGCMVDRNGDEARQPIIRLQRNRLPRILGSPCGVRHRLRWRSLYGPLP